MSDDLDVRREGESIAAFGRRRAEALGLVKQPEPQPESLSWDEDLIPAIDPATAPSIERVEIDSIVKPIDIVQAYIKWSHKMTPNAKGRSESIMVSCPNPAHPDKNPSAWLTMNKGDGGVGNCAVCGGFDKYDIAAWSYGYDVPSYRRTDFPDVVRRMAEDMGYRVMTQGKDEWAEKLPSNEAPTPTAPAAAAPAESSTPASTPAAPPATLSPGPDPKPADIEYILPPPMIDWRELPGITPGTFLHSWMECTSESYEPEEFYLWLGLSLLGLAVGNDVTLKDNPDVRANMLLCLVGSTGSGKSIAIRIAEGLLHHSFPWNDANGSGIRLLGSPGSGEALVDSFNHSIDDPSGAGGKIMVPVKGLYKENELSTFVKKASRTGSTIREVIMDMFDSANPVGISSRGAGTVTARDHYMSIISSTQPDALGGLMTNQDAASGFLNRWVYAYGKHKHRPARAGYRPDTDPLIDPLRNIRAWGSRGRQVDWFDLGAGIAFDAFYDARVRPLIDDDDGSSPLVARLPLLAKKLVLLLAINDKSTTVVANHVETVEMLWDYILESYGLVGRRVSLNDEGDCVQRIRLYMAARPGESFTIRQITKQSGAKKYATQSGLIAKCISILVGIGEIQEIPRQRSSVGQAAIKYSYVADEAPAPASGATVLAFPSGSA